MPDLFPNPQMVTFEHHRWYSIIRIVDRFGYDRYFRASADGSDTGGDGLYFAEVAADGHTEVQR